MSENIYIIIPTLNEENTIKETITGLLKLNLGKIIVVDDNSDDCTWAIVIKIKESNPHVYLLERRGERSFTKSYMEGFKYAFNLGANVIVQMDADGSHLPSDVSELLKKINNYNCVVGSRYVRGGKIINWSIKRRIISRLGNFYAKFLLHIPVYDCTSGFMAWNANSLKGFEGQWSKIPTNNFTFLIWLKMLAWKNKLSITETPITFVERRFDRSKYRNSLLIKGFIEIIKIRLSMFF